MNEEKEQPASVLHWKFFEATLNRSPGQNHADRELQYPHIPKHPAEDPMHPYGMD